MSKKRRFFLGAIVVVFIAAALTVMSLTAYFAKGVFKDVFVNKKDYFSADVLYSISRIDEENKREVGSFGVRREINIYNHDVSSGDFNAFDITFDVYAWLESPLEGKEYTIFYGDNGNSVSVSTTDHAAPVISGLTLPGGKSSTATLKVDFGYQENEDITSLPGLHLVAVPTEPERISKSYLGALLRPTRSDAFAVNYDFVHTGAVKDYAAFTYRVSTVGTAQEGDNIVIKWKSGALTLIRVNSKAPDADAVQDIVSEDGFDKMIVLDVQSNHTDNFVFFRNTESDIWETANQDWNLVRSQISTEYVKNGTQG
ncbi:MAG: hypothetical protein ACI4QR_04720 [Eubacteriales bacterium]